MITANQAEQVAQDAMMRYIRDCKCDTQSDVANALVKLASMCGLGMCAMVGQSDAVIRLQSVADHIATTQEGVNWKRESLQ